ncbi:MULTISPECIES: hypothetical protein [unclassified Gilliamella]|nr:hypothetical protein [Gilliamella apicola]
MKEFDFVHNDDDTKRLPPEVRRFYILVAQFELLDMEQTKG